MQAFISGRYFELSRSKRSLFSARFRVRVGASHADRGRGGDRGHDDGGHVRGRDHARVHAHVRDHADGLDRPSDTCPYRTYRSAYNRPRLTPEHSRLALQRGGDDFLEPRPLRPQTQGRLYDTCTTHKSVVARRQTPDDQPDLLG